MSDRPALPMLLVGLSAILIGLAIVMQFLGGTPGESAEMSPGSVDNRGAEGTYGWRAVLERVGFETRRLEDAFDRRLPETGVIVSVLPQDVEHSEIEALAAWLIDDPERRRVVLVGEPEGPLVEQLVPVSGVSRAPDGRIEPVAESTYTEGMDFLDLSPLDTFEPGDTEVLYAVASDPTAAYAVLTAASSGGTVVAVTDAAAVVNERLTEGQNAGFAVRLVGPPDLPVYFDEYHHAAPATPGVFGFLPHNVQVFLLQVVLACIVFAVGASVRFGPPLPEPEEAPRRRVEFVNAMGRAYRESGAAAQAAEHVRTDLRDLLRRKLGAGAVDDSHLVTYAGAAGLDPGDVQLALQRPVFRDGDLVEVAAAASRCRAILASGPTPKGS